MKRLDLSAELTHQVAGDLTGSLRGSGKYQPQDTTEIGTKNPFQYIARKRFFFSPSLLCSVLLECVIRPHVCSSARHMPWVLILVTSVRVSGRYLLRTHEPWCYRRPTLASGSWEDE